MAIDRIRQLQDYVVRRLRAEAKGPRGTQARLARALGISSAHMANLLGRDGKAPTRHPGEELRRQAALHWGLSYAELERLACGGEPTPTPSAAAETMSELRQMVREEIDAALERERPSDARDLKAKHSSGEHAIDLAADETRATSRER